MRFLVALFIFLGSVVHDCYAQPNSELSKDTSKWYNRTQHLEGVTVKSKRSRYDALMSVELPAGVEIEVKI